MWPFKKKEETVEKISVVTERSYSIQHRHECGKIHVELPKILTSTELFCSSCGASNANWKKIVVRDSWTHSRVVYVYTAPCYEVTKHLYEYRDHPLIEPDSDDNIWLPI